MKCGLYLFCFTVLVGSRTAYGSILIVGGEVADIKDFPYQASIHLLGEHICGACIISERHILTAARCITDHVEIAKPYDKVNISTGTTSSKNAIHLHAIAEVNIFPEWDDSGKTFYQHDIAVITLQNQIIFDDTQRQVGLPTHDIVSGKEGVFSGWGQTSPGPNGKTADVLQKINLKIFNSTDCYIDQMHANQFCTYYKGAGHGPCYGDHGSPLVVDNQVVGVFSWLNAGDCATGAPEIYTNVYSYRDFIDSILNKKQ